MNFKSYIKNNKIVGLSPMDGVTDEAMRLLQAKVAKADVVFTEFVSAEGLSNGGIKLFQKLLYSPNERPIIAQLFGKNPDSFYKSTIILSELGFDGIDINMGCPSKKVSGHGSGAALIDNPQLAIEIIRAVRAGTMDWYQQENLIEKIGLKNKTKQQLDENKKYSNLDKNKKDILTVSVKTRLGTKEITIEKWAEVLIKEEIDLLTIHGRTLRQGYAGLTNWEEIAKVVKMAKNSGVAIWGNGDVFSRQEAVLKIERYGVGGVLIGRKAIGNPWVFEEKERSVSAEERKKIMLEHLEIFQKVFPNRKTDCLRSKFLAYTKGLRNAKQLRKQIVRIETKKDLLKIDFEINDRMGNVDR